MAKIYGLFGTMTGKLADTVMSVRNGEQIARKYQPIVFNPSTPAQVAQRAKLKLLSQLSAVLANTIAIPREGTVSSRNLFTKLNFPAVTYSTQEQQASVVLENVQITKSAIAAPDIETFARGDSKITASVYGSSLPAGVSRVVYVLCKKANGSLIVAQSAVADSAGTGGNWEIEFPLYSEELVLYAYAIRDNTETARTKFGELQVVNAETIAKLLVNRVVTESDITLTRTAASSLATTNREVNETEKSTKKK